MVAAFLDQSAFDQHRNYGSILVIQHASDVGECEPVVDEKVADCNGSFSLRIEIRAIARQVKLVLTHLKTISSFAIGLSHDASLYRIKKPGT